MKPPAAHPHAIIHTQWVLLWSAGFAIYTLKYWRILSWD